LLKTLERRSYSGCPINTNKTRGSRLKNQPLFILNEYIVQMPRARRKPLIEKNKNTSRVTKNSTGMYKRPLNSFGELATAIKAAI